MCRSLVSLCCCECEANGEENLENLPQNKYCCLTGRNSERKMEGIDQLTIETVEMHTGGEPLRIIISGYPEIKGKTILDKRRYLKENLDYLRRFLIFEPRGHYDQYGALLVKPDEESADLAVIFMHNEGYSTMCGHAVIALGRFAIDHGYVKVDSALNRESLKCIFFTSLAADLPVWSILYLLCT